MIKTYSELIKIQTFEERFEYLKLGGIVGNETFGYDRYLNQILYHSNEWRQFRNEVLLRDNGCDLGFPDREIYARAIVHHINVVTIENIENRDDCIFDFENVITTVHNTHLAIHYGDESLLTRLPAKRTKGDTCPWKAY